MSNQIKGWQEQEEGRYSGQNERKFVWVRTGGKFWGKPRFIWCSFELAIFFQQGRVRHKGRWGRHGYAEGSSWSTRWRARRTQHFLWWFLRLNRQFSIKSRFVPTSYKNWIRPHKNKKKFIKILELPPPFSIQYHQRHVMTPSNLQIFTLLKENSAILMLGSKHQHLILWAKAWPNRKTSPFLPFPTRFLLISWLILAQRETKDAPYSRLHSKQNQLWRQEGFRC